MANTSGGAAAKLAAEGLGGGGNIVSLGSCLTRLRVVVRDAGLVDRDSLIALGAAGIIGKGEALQVVVGTIADELTQLIKQNL